MVFCSILLKYSAACRPIINLRNIYNKEVWPLLVEMYFHNQLDYFFSARDIIMIIDRLYNCPNKLIRSRKLRL